MRERKYVKFRVDMYEDTKFKIIDRMPERDVIHYIWTRIVTLAGKVNLEGNLYMSKNIPYTIDTLAIEFNRDVNQVKLALDTFIKLEMVEVTEEKIYKVKNFVKHQNIKVKSKDNEKETKKEETHVKSEENKINDDIENQKLENKEKETDNNITGKVNNSLQSDLILLEMEKGKKSNQRGRKDIDTKTTGEEVNNYSIVSFYEGGERPLGDGEGVVGEWSFG